MRILVSGANGFVGSELSKRLALRGHDVIPLSRTRMSPQTVVWAPESNMIESGKLAGLDVVIHLAGETIASRWTAARKRQIRESRIRGTRLLVESLASSTDPPATLICASAVGYYGDRGSEILTESSSSGSGFLAEVCRDWEQAAQAAAPRGIRVVSTRFGVVLAANGGILKKLLLPFRLGLGGRVGTGAQFMSWISLDDVCSALLHLIEARELSGPVNVVAPGPVTNADFTRTLGRVLSRPTIFPLPAIAARIVFGQMADELLLSSARVVPEALLASKFSFAHPDLDSALRFSLGKI